MTRKILRTIPFLFFFILLFSSSVSAATNEIKMYISEPEYSIIFDKEVSIAVQVYSLYEIKTVTAKVDNKVVSLSYSPVGLCRYGGCDPAWVGTLSLADMPDGQIILSATATDIFNNTKEASRTFTYYKAPDLVVNEPYNESVARTNLDISATATDDSGPAAMKVYLDNIIALRGTGSIQETIDLAPYNGRVVNLRVDASGANHGFASIEKTIYVEASSHVKQVDEVVGTVWDYNNDKILYRNSANQLFIKNRLNGQVTLIKKGYGILKYGYLTPKGAMFVEDLNNKSVLYDYSDGVLTDLGTIESGQSLYVSGNYAVYNKGSLGKTLILRNLINGNDSVVSTVALNWKNVVSEDGTVVYHNSQTKQIEKYKNGNVVQVSNSEINKSAYGPLTDGINIMYYKVNTSNNTYSIILHNGTEEIILSDLGTTQPSKSTGYQINNSWAAYIKPGSAGQSQVWLRSPQGEEKQITYFGTSSQIESLGSTGEILFKNNGKVYYSSFQSTGEPQPISTALGTRSWKDGKWFTILGCTLNEINLDFNDMVAPQTTYKVIKKDMIAYERYKSLIYQLIATDNSSGVDRIEYRINDGTWETYTEAITLNAESTLKLEYRSVDKAGNVENTWVADFVNGTLTQQG